MMGHMLHLLRHFMHTLQIAAFFHGDAQFFNRPGQMSNLIVLIEIGRYTVRLFMGDAGKGVNKQRNRTE